MQIFTNIIFPALATLIAGIFLWRYNSKPKLNFHFNSLGYAITFPPKENAQFNSPIPQMTHSLTILNGGKVPLKNIQILHVIDISHDKQNAKGNNSLIALGILPNLPYKFSEDGKILIFESLAPNESVTINYIYPIRPDLNFNVIHQFYSPGIPMIRSEEAIGEPINFVKSTPFPKLVGSMIYVFIVIGFWVSATFLANLFALVKLYFICNNAM